MALIKNNIAVEFHSVITLNEMELRALDALVGYDDDAFLAVFKEKLGSAYIEPYEGGLRSAFEAIRRDIKPALAEISNIRRTLKEKV